MSFLRQLLDKQEHYFVHGKLKKFYPLYEAIDTFLYTPATVTTGKTHVRDGIDLKRMMITVAMALVPVVLMSMFNTGLQANMVLSKLSSVPANWRYDILSLLGLGLDPANPLANIVHGALYFLPIYIVTMAAGGIWEAIFASVRKHEINEGFVVTGLLFPLTLPATIPLWQVAIGISFGVVLGKEVFGGTGKNFLNPALTARAFLFFAYPAQISGDGVWLAVDGVTQATALAQAAVGGVPAITFDWLQAFLGIVPGSMGETSALACLLGAGFLIFNKIGSWRIMLSVCVGAFLTVGLLNLIGSDTNPMFAMPWYWHFVLGGFAFGCVFMATDPVSASMTECGQYFYGALIGFMVILVRVINPAYPEGMMLAILFGNIFAPLIDYFVVNANIKRRLVRNEQ